jgi:cell division protein FtsZ
MASGTSPIGSAFNESDEVLARSVKTVVNLILLPAVINLDFADVRNTLLDSGVALIGFGLGSGANRSREAAENAINSPLLEVSISGARRAIVAVTCGPQVTLLEAHETVNILTEAAGHDIDIKFGIAINDQLTDEILVSVIASDFENAIDFSAVTSYTPAKKVETEAPAVSRNLFGEPEVLETPTIQEQRVETPTKEDAVSSDDILPSFLKD